MNPFARRNAATVSTVIELGAAHLTVARCRWEGAGKLRVEALVSNRFVPSDQATGEVDWMASGGAAEQESGSNHPPSGPVIWVMPGHLGLTKVLRIPAVGPEQRERIVAFEARQAIPFPLDEVVWDYQTVVEGDLETSILIAAAKAEAVAAGVTELTSRGLEPEAIVPAGLALVQAYRRRAGATGAEESTLLLGLGARSSHLILVQGADYSLRTLTLGGNTVTRTIADELGLPFEQAEQLKRQVVTTEPVQPMESQVAAVVASARRTFVERLALEISRSLITHQRNQGGSGPHRVVLAGGGAEMRGLCESLQERLRRPVERFDPWEGIETTPEVLATVEKIGRWHFAEVLGAADWAAPAAASATSQTKRVNLLPAALFRLQTARRQRPRWWAAGAMLALAIALPGLHEWRLAVARDRLAADIASTLAPHYVWQSQNRSHLEQLERLAATDAALADLIVAQRGWPGFLADLQTRMVAVEDVWLERLQVLPPTTPPAARAATNRADAGLAEDGAPALPAEPLRLRVSGRLLDRANPLSHVSPSSYERATALLSRFVESPYVNAVEGERFDAADPGILRFDFTLVINPAMHL